LLSAENPLLEGVVAPQVFSLWTMLLSIKDSQHVKNKETIESRKSTC